MFFYQIRQNCCRSVFINTLLRIFSYKRRENQHIIALLCVFEKNKSIHYILHGYLDASKANACMYRGIIIYRIRLSTVPYLAAPGGLPPPMCPERGIPQKRVCRTTLDNGQVIYTKYWQRCKEIAGSGRRTKTRVKLYTSIFILSPEAYPPPADRRFLRPAYT